MCANDACGGSLSSCWGWDSEAWTTILFPARVRVPSHGLAARQTRPAARRRASRSRTRLRDGTAFLGLRRGHLAGRPQRAAGGARARGRCAHSRSGRLPPDSSASSAPRPPLLSSHHTRIAPYGRTSEERGRGTPMAISRPVPVHTMPLPPPPLHCRSPRLRRVPSVTPPTPISNDERSTAYCLSPTTARPRRAPASTRVHSRHRSCLGCRLVPPRVPPPPSRAAPCSCTHTAQLARSPPPPLPATALPPSTSARKRHTFGAAPPPPAGACS